jgi:RNA polymerase sigma-70 factor, ECF subfamily
MKFRLPQATSAVAELSLSERIRTGDPSAESELVHAFSQRIYVMAVVRTRDAEAARDLVQEVLIAVLQALRNGTLHEADRLPAFIQGTARNVVNNYLRTRSKHPAHVPISPELSASTAPKQVDTAGRTQLMRRALVRLGVLDRKILLLTLVDGLKPAEIAGQLGLKPDVIRTRKSRAIRKVTECIKKLS